MQFLPYQFPSLGSGFLIGLNAIVHVLVSHGFSIGAVAMVVLAEYLGLRGGSRQWDEFAKRLLKVSIIILTSVGAMSGVGIWLTTSAVAPRAIGSLLRVFFWPWFTEWIVFTLEVVVIMTYYFSWDRWEGASNRWHFRLGLVYIGLASTSAFIISGILGFMLTPADWPSNHSLFTGFFNPTFLPQFFLRMSSAIVMGAVVAVGFLLLHRWEHDFQQQALRSFGRLLCVALPLATLLALWYFSVVPERLRTFAAYAVLTSRWASRPELLWIITGTAAAVLVLSAGTWMAGSIRFARLLQIPAMLAIVLLASEFERIREFIRGPYLIPGYMYANQVLIDEMADDRRLGTIDGSYWYPTLASEPVRQGPGEFLFSQNCAACHTIHGVNGISDRVAGRSRDGIFVIIGHTHDMIPFMPPFSGSAEEQYVLADYLFNLARTAPASADVSPFRRATTPGQTIP